MRSGGMLSARTRAALERLLAIDAAPTESAKRADDASSSLDRLAAIREALAELDTDPAALSAVRAALDAGATWTEVAYAAQLSAAACRWRWQGDDSEIVARHEAGRKRSERPSSKPTELPGLSVSEAAKQLGVTVQAVYLRVSRGHLRSETLTLPDGRSYKRVFPDSPLDSETA